MAASFFIAAALSGCIEAFSWALLAAQKNELLVQALEDNPLFPWSSFMAVIGLGYAAWRSEPKSRSRLAWGIMAFAQALDFSGNLFWPADGVPHYGRTFLSMADKYFLAFYILFVLGIFLLPMARLALRERLKILLDMGIVTITAAMLLWAFLIRPLFLAGGEVAVPTSVAYPVLDLLLLFALLELLYHGMSSPQQIPMAILACGITADIAGDVIFSYHSIQGTFVLGGWADHIWVLYYLLVGLAGIWHAEASHILGGSKDLRQLQFSWTRHLPYISIGLAYLLLAWAHEPLISDPIYPFLLGIGGILGLATVRQVMVLNENIALNKAAQKEAAQRKEAEESYRHLVDNSQQGLMIIDLNRIIFVNQALAKITSYSVDELMAFTGEDLRAWVHPEDREMVWSRYRERLQGADVPDIYDYRGMRKDGSLVWVEMKVSVFYKSDGTPVSQATFVDITKRKLAEEALSKSEARYRSLVEQATDGIFLSDENGCCIDVNTRAHEMLGLTRTEIIGRRLIDLIPPQDREAQPPDLLFIPPGETRRIEIRLLRKDGTTIPIEINARMTDENKFQAIVRDISDRKRAEEMLNAFFSVSPAGLAIVDEKLRFVKINEMAAQMNGYPAELHMGRTVPEILPKLAPFLVPLCRRILDTGEPALNVEVIGETPKEPGALRYWLASYFPIKDADGARRYIGSVMVEVTERKLAQDLLLASLKEKEVLLKEVHHRVKNNLQIISSLINMQSRRVQNSDAVEAFKESQNRIMSMALIHETLYRSSDLSSIKFSEYARSLGRSLLYSYEPGGRIRIEFDLDDATLGIDRAIPCGLIINELVSNCLKHAFPDGRQGLVSLEMHALNGKELALVVRDDGIGLPSDLDLRATKSLGMTLVRS
ncbi:MAG TPA: PAS domain S-box protein, partial [Methanotrichaceae archaeon]|nr:PAS domain S-box protein [Methanotrichaceae archaeon]